MFCTGGHDINPRGINAAVPQDVRQLGDVFLNAVKGPGKQFAKAAATSALEPPAQCSSPPKNAVRMLPTACTPLPTPTAVTT